MNKLRFSITLFFACFIFYVKAETSSAEVEKNKAIEIFANLDESGNYSNNLAISDLNNLPMGLSKHISTIEYTVAVHSFEVLPDHAKISVYGRVKIPQVQNGERKDKLLFFGAQGIKLSFEGNIVGEAKLQLLGDVGIPIHGNKSELILKGNFNNLTGQSQDLTYMEIDCNGFKELGLVADLFFSEDMIRRVDGAGIPIQGIQGRVSTSLRTVVSDWNDILVAINLPQFEMVGLNGFIFDVKNAVFDFSDSKNDPSALFSNDYIQNYLTATNPELWKGVFISELTVALPKQFSKNNSDTRVSFAAQHLILDNNGISGLFKAGGILPISEGNAGGWRFSVDDFSIELEANQIIGAGFTGRIGLPVSDTSTLAYNAFISPDNEYFLKVTPADLIDFNVWSAQGTILPSSYIELKVENNKFLPEAVLYGHLDIHAKLNNTSDKSIAQLNGIQFRKLHLRTEAPYVSVEYFGYNGEVGLKGFPLSITKIELTTNNNTAALGFDAKLSLGSDKNGIVGQTNLSIVGKIAESKGLQRWKYEKMAISEIAIDAKMAEVFSLKGSLTLMNDDPVYGDGFAGNIDLKLDVFKSSKVSAGVKAIFGKKDFKYWCVEGNASFGRGIPIFPPINLSGFGGGAYYKMSPALAGPSGINYKPNNDVALGLKAAVKFNAGSDKAINGEALFEIAFNNNGGVNFMGFFGQAKFLGTIPGSENVQKFVKDKFAGIVEKEKQYLGNLAAMQKLEKLKMFEPNKAASEVFDSKESPGDAGFIAKLGIQYDFTKQSLHSTFDLHVNVIGGMIKGRSSGGRAGWAVLHIEENDWYLHMGRPDDRLGLRLNLAGLVNMETGGYFMMGSQIPASPPPPRQVADILGLDVEKLNYMRDLNSLGEGKGLAFGSNFLVSTGDITFLILYANFQAGLGFDVMLKDYQDAQCKGRSGVIGIDGWYANGQGYAFLQGEVGVKVNLLFVKKKIPIIKGAAATLMQAKLPNPAWFAGYLGVKFDLLGGLVKGNVRLKLSFGEECELVMPGGSPLGVRVISDLTPQDQSDDVDVFAVPQAVFNIPVEKPFEMEDDNGSKFYKLKMDDFHVSQNGQRIEGKWKLNSAKDAVLFYSKEVLPPNVELKAKVRIIFEELRGNNWFTVNTAGKQAEETMEIAFKTGNAPKVIPLHNIEYCYPVIDQKYLYPKESNKGYVQLKRGQSYLFSNDMKHEISIADQKMQFRYNTADNRIEYTLPSINTSAEHQFVLTSYALNSNTNSANEDNRVSLGSNENEISMRDAKALNVIRDDAGQVLLQYNFNSSAYNTFAAKMKAIVKVKPWAGRVLSDVINLTYEVQNGEHFDLAELVGTSFTAGIPLVEAKTVLTTDDYYNKLIYPLIYKDYASLGVKINNRATQEYGVPPAKALPVNAKYLTDLENGVKISSNRFPYTYNLPFVYKMDFLNLRSQIVNKGNSMYYGRFATGSYSFIPEGYYKINLQYTLPDGANGTSADFEYFNFIK